MWRASKYVTRACAAQGANKYGAMSRSVMSSTSLLVLRADCAADFNFTETDWNKVVLNLNFKT